MIKIEKPAEAGEEGLCPCCGLNGVHFCQGVNSTGKEDENSRFTLLTDFEEGGNVSACLN